MNRVIFYSASPMESAKVDALMKELAIQREINRKLETKLFLYVETAEGNVNRMTFRSYVRAVLYRDETDSEWKQFVSTFSFNTLPFSMKVYDWIEENMTHKRRICDMKIDLESRRPSVVSIASIVSSELQEVEFKPIRIELESWPSDVSQSIESASQATEHSHDAHTIT
jgi:hypothetical protein